MAVDNKKLLSVGENLKKKGFYVEVFATGEEAVSWCESKIADGNTVGFGGSMTVAELGLETRLKEKGAITYSHTTASPENAAEVMKNAMFSDYYIASANALIETGEIFNVDGRGNRVAAITYGPKEVILFVGVNKLVSDIDQALERLRTNVAPQNAQRLNRSTPCVKTGVCANCNSPQRVCRSYFVLERPCVGMKVTVALIDQELGY